MKVTLYDPVQAHKVFSEAYQKAKPYLMAGNRLVFSLEKEKRTNEQNRRYWGRGILAQIAEQARIGGRRYSAEAWHEQFKRQFLGVIELPSGQVVGKSTTKLSKAKFSEFSDQVEAYAVTELGVVFVDLEDHESSQESKS